MLGLKKIGNKAIKVLRAKNDNNGEISLFDVKELYDAAFVEKDKARVNLKKFTALMAKAEQLDFFTARNSCRFNLFNIKRQRNEHSI
jgi:hypothetical protein